MALVEDATEANDSGRPAGEPGPSTSAELVRTLNALSKRLSLPEELLPSFLDGEKPTEALETYQNHALSILRQIQSHTRSAAWSELSSEGQAEVVMDLVRLYGEDEWTSSQIRDIINDMTTTVDRCSIAIHLLMNSLRTLFQPTPHPMLNTSTSRALTRPAGGKDASSDFHDTASRTFKAPSAWGCHNILSWCADILSPDEFERRIGLILPPTLILMDDWEPAWRGRGITVLSVWIEKLPAETLRRMGVDKLLIKSLLHSCSLHSSPPLRGLVSVTIRMIEYTTSGEKRAMRYDELMNKAIIEGWTYAPSGKEGRLVLRLIASDLEEICRVLGAGVVRWLKAIIPNLLDPLQYSPTAAVLPHYEANLSALLCVIISVGGTGRIGRWRGQILDILSRLWVQLGERGADHLNPADRAVMDVRHLVTEILNELEKQCPAVRESEYRDMIQLDREVFQSMIPSTA